MKNDKSKLLLKFDENKQTESKSNNSGLMKENIQNITELMV